MKRKNKVLKTVSVIFLISFCGIKTNAQVVTSRPVYPTINDEVVVIFNAKEGDAGLKGFTGDVYAHTGVITNKSNLPSDWKYVKTSWGQNTPDTKLTGTGQDLWELNIGDIRTYYGIPKSEKVLKLTFVFRSSDASKTGRDVNGADIFMPLFEPGLTVVLQQPALDESFGIPARSPVFAESGDSVNIVATAAAIGTQISSLALFVEKNEIYKSESDTLKFSLPTINLSSGFKEISIVGKDTASISDSVSFLLMINPPAKDNPIPAGIIDGINYNGNSSVTFSLFAPYKKFVYLLGDFNDWTVDTSYFMNRDEIDADNVRYWLTVDGLDPNEEYAFQYLVDGSIRIADPYTEKVLDPWNDRYISPSVYPNLKPYPNGKTNEIVSVLQINRPEYQWHVQNFQRPEKEKLVIYELLIRDFVAAHNYQTLIDTLGYFQKLGINAIELMPINEFEGNESWGYNPSFYFAPDKYYGTKNKLMEFIDTCHQYGIAVIIDMVLNHSFGQSPFVRLYNEENYGKPTSENPWLNVDAKHPFNVGYDFNHESSQTKALVDRVTGFWLSEYKIDGFRFDLSKGFTQKYSATVSGWGSYDPSRIAILKRMADEIWSVDSTAYIILEHFAENREDKELADYGMMLWGNMNSPYSQSAMGWLNDNYRSSDLSGIYFKSRNFKGPNLLGYMESHDEPWLMYKNLRYGRSSGSYSIKNLPTALDRIKLASAFFFTIPGPKMMWQFGELGYDQYLAESGSERTAPKPILWNYYQLEDRKKLFKVVSALIKLRTENELFTSGETSVSMRVGQGVSERRINLSHNSMNATIIGNFDVVSKAVIPNFQSQEIWYNYFVGDSIFVSDTNKPIFLMPGEFHIYTSKKLEPPEKGLVISEVEMKAEDLPTSFSLQQNYPNPFNPATTIKFSLPKNEFVELKIYSLLGKKIETIVSKQFPAGNHQIIWSANSLPSGVYFYQIQAGNFKETKKMLLIE